MAESRTGPPSFAVEDDDIEETKQNQVDLGRSREVRPYLALIATSKQTNERVFQLGDDERIIGRHAECAIRIDSEGVSRKHAAIAFQNGEYWLRDLGSSNGTFLNGAKIEGAYRLAKGDRVLLGPSCLLRFDWPDTGFSSSEHTTSVRIAAAWAPTSWTLKPIAQAPEYDNPAEVKHVAAQLATLPPLVSVWEIERLKALIAEAQRGDRFLLQGGDCAETLADCDPSVITNKLKILLQMSLVLTHATRKPIIRVGRFAGQYAKPRSKPTETKNGAELPCYFGDLVNRAEFSREARRPDPSLLLLGYEHAAATLNYVRAFCNGGFSEAHHPEYFELSTFDRANLTAAVREEFDRMRRHVAEGLHFVRAMGDRMLGEQSAFEFYASHEGLNLHYESAQTRYAAHADRHYCLTTHLPWIGDRTRQIDGAHVEFFRGIANPIGVKVGPSMAPADLLTLVRLLNPDDEPGKIILIARMGAQAVASKLPPLIDAVQRSRRRVLWVSDPMHGNAMLTKTGVKTRNFDDILLEITESFATHERCGTQLGGIHFELTGDDVTECIGAGLTETDLDTRYLTRCDPRLNYRQAMEMAFCVAQKIVGSTARRPSRPPLSGTRPGPLR